MVRNSPSESATLYKLGAKRKGNVMDYCSQC